MEKGNALLSRFRRVIGNEENALASSAHTRKERVYPFKHIVAPPQNAVTVEHNR